MPFITAQHLAGRKWAIHSNKN